MTINLTKSVFCCQEAKFLGHIISPEGIGVDPEKTAATRNFPLPQSRKQLRGFLGLCNYYRRYSFPYSHVMALLTQLLKKTTVWHWGKEEKSVFSRVNDLFSDTVVLRFPDFEKPIHLQTDSSGFLVNVNC